MASAQRKETVHRFASVSATSEISNTPVPKPRQADLTAVPKPRLGTLLVKMQAISPQNLARGWLENKTTKRELADVLRANGNVPELALLRAQAQELGFGLADFSAPPHDDDFVKLLPKELALETLSVPWQRTGNILVIATAAPEHRERLSRALEDKGFFATFCLAPRAVIMDILTQAYGAELRCDAEAMPPLQMSCRTQGGLPYVMVALFSMLVFGMVFVPKATIIALTLLALASLFAQTVLKVVFLLYAGYALEIKKMSRRSQRPLKVSLLLPLFKERNIADLLVKRIAKLDYPRSLLEVCLVVEEHDWETRNALANAALPAWFRTILVPDGQPRTKPRAMNYALNFTQGDIIGIYDAEDAPQAHHIERVAAHFQQAEDRVACLQGCLDFYNHGTNWVARCFTIEYATWFRTILPGLSQVGMPVPLGGTTVFLRKSALVEIGGWDAHNVTEDADLGLRLARAGYRTELIDITTFEEANSAVWPWIKQRSRWLKGYLMTYAVHCRNQRQLWKDLGPIGWLGVHLHFGGSLLNVSLTPIVLSLLIGYLGVSHPFLERIGPVGAYVITWLLVLSGLVTVLTNVLGCAYAGHRKLMKWIPLTFIYQCLSFFAIVKAFYESVVQPYYWDKTSHGKFSTAEHKAPDS